MKEKIWRTLAQILSHRPDLVDIIKPIYENLKNESINDDKYYPLLRTFSDYQLEDLYQNGIITVAKIFHKKRFFLPNEFNNRIEKIISNDNVEKLQHLIQKTDINQLKTILKSFKEVKKMIIPLIQYCIMKNAEKCFKFLLVNGYDDPMKIMEELDLCKNKHRYEWDCMATSIYFGNKEIMKILERENFEIIQKETYITAAILSYRNEIIEKIIDEMNLKNSINQKYLGTGLILSLKNGNIKGRELLLRNEWTINPLDKKMNSNYKIEHPFILQQSIIQKR